MNAIKHLIPLFILSTLPFFKLLGQENCLCNGYKELCNKSYSDVSFIMTHNAFNSSDNYWFPNHNSGIKSQLKSGIRAFMIDVYSIDNKTFTYHSISSLGKQPLSKSLGAIYQFLLENRSEVISIIFESWVEASVLEKELKTAGLFEYLHKQSIEEEWPSLGTLIDLDKRLIVFTERNNSEGREWHHYAWDFIFDTSYSAKNEDQFDCKINRGKETNKLSLLNHFITTRIGGFGNEEIAKKINASDYITDRCKDCNLEWVQKVNFIGIDFFSFCNLNEVKKRLNDL